MTWENMITQGAGQMRKSNQDKGFTLMELLIAALLTVIISSAALTFYVRANQQYFSQEDISEMQQCARASLQEIVKQTRMAGFGIPDSVSAVEIDSIAGSPDTLTIHRDTFEIKYYVNIPNDSLHPTLIKEVNGNASIYSDDISDLRASWVPPASVRITITARTPKKDMGVRKGQYLTRSETQIINLRNTR
jgi:prepilin-type N-terminal cleavage/methylation domain-containing protein